ncbi:MAG: hypothetical protein EBZ77_07655 [Chitinophagia bacterium]|nr:hypothetical protein [Chitinophagia bacterium]
MKRLLTILLLALFSFNTAGVGQLCKLPFLLQHYLEHRSEDPSITLADFLWQHYVTTDNHPDHTEKHRKLPFKSGHSVSFSINLQTQVVPGNNLALAWFSPCRVKVWLPRRNWLTAHFHSSIWKPPQIC